MTQLRRVVRNRHVAPAGAAVAAVSLLLAAQVSVPEPFQKLRHYAFDTLQRTVPRADAEAAAPGTGVVVVDIDEASLTRHGQWPWSRALVAALLGRLQDAGAAVIGLDFVFAEPDRTSPATLAPAWARDHGLTVSQHDGRDALPDFDRELATVIARGRIVTGYGLLPTSNGKAPELTNGVAVVGTDPSRSFSGFRGAVPNLPSLDAAAAGQGSFTVIATGRDEIIRRLPLFMTLNGTIVPSLVAEVLRVAAGEDEDGLRLRAENQAGPTTPVAGYTAQVGRWTVPIEPDGAIWLHYGVRDPRRTLSAAAALDDTQAEALKQAVSGRIVLLGTSAVGLSDLRPTPLSPFEPGVAIHAAAIEQVLAGAILQRPFYAEVLETRTAALFGLGVGLLVAAGRLRAGTFVLVVGSALALGGAFVAFAWFDLLLDPTFLPLAGAGAFVAALGVRHLASERRANAMRTAFSRYLSPQFVEALARDPDRLQLGGEDREMTFLFTDLEGFTSFTEAVDPAMLVSTLNSYLDGVCAIAMDHGGTIDKIVGDAVHVMFNAPVAQLDHAARAVRCGLAIDAFSEMFAQDAVRHAATGRRFGTTRIGINTGRAVVGNFGGKRRFDYTAHGDAINTAARLEAVNKRLGTRICVSRATVEAAKGAGDLRFRPIGALELKGKSALVEVFAPISPGAAETGWADRYGDAFARLSHEEAGGAEAILALLSIYPEDPLLRFHAERIGRGQRGTRVPLQAA